MSYRPQIVDLTTASRNEEAGLYEFTMKLADGTLCRVFYSRDPEWKMTSISRLQKTPCPVCRKDFICKCMEKFAGEIHEQIQDNQLIEQATK
ncbi:hypothetical protein PUW24_13975 [Paenibacillus urinalis]|uniref:Zinc-ribbon domain-containing protein n=2 Tax=Paenibacillus TaxID=44249 RepID=A0AAX3N5B1_9BACL|nr:MULTISPECIES: hypothetical protein [Paenibacillus]WDH83879.1 hypothetical protein PUW23_06575 [Paenibacillus urinalis]WDH95337.1 hypothetical protein PUW24_13975 [Paenibacillus urinalis]WDI03532.1 hypothetical protein PUW25_06100 [Paenibacillus urinalis]SDX29140.1 hypothetical protein SAMN05518848_10635 [Paenibacillus sp. PDC88]